MNRFFRTFAPGLPRVFGIYVTLAWIVGVGILLVGPYSIVIHPGLQIDRWSLVGLVLFTTVAGLLVVVVPVAWSVEDIEGWSPKEV